MLKKKIQERELHCFEFLNQIPLDRKYVLVGGYAVSSFHFPRLSVDLDIIIPEGEAEFFRKLIGKQGFALSLERSDFDLTYGGRFERHVKGEEMPVSIDLLIDSIQSRQTGYAYSFAYVFKSSEIREIRGWQPLARAKARVADKEMLIALKINSMRTTDKRDILMLCYEKPDASKLASHLAKCPREIILKHIEELKTLLTTAKQIDSIKGVFSISTEVLEKAKKNCREALEEVVNKLGKEKDGR